MSPVTARIAVPRARPAASMSCEISTAIEDRFKRPNRSEHQHAPAPRSRIKSSGEGRSVSIAAAKSCSRCALSSSVSEPAGENGFVRSQTVEPVRLRYSFSACLVSATRSTELSRHVGATARATQACRQPTPRRAILARITIATESKEEQRIAQEKRRNGDRTEESADRQIPAGWRAGRRPAARHRAWDEGPCDHKHPDAQSKVLDRTGLSSHEPTRADVARSMLLCLTSVAPFLL